MRRLGLIILAVALVLGGAAILGFFNLQRASLTAANATQVVVAARPIDLGQTITPAMLRMQVWPAGAVPPGAFTQISELVGGDARVALRTIEPNEPILASRVSGAGGRATLSATIAEGHRAVAIRVNDVIGVGGFVLPGDFVDVLLTRDDGNNRGGDQSMRTDLLIANVRVLAIDQTASESGDDPQVARAVTIEVTPADGQKVALATQVGTLSLALRRADEIGPANAAPPSQGTIRIQDLRNETARSPQQVSPRPRTTSRRPARPSGPSIEIVRGATSNHAIVASE